MRSRTESRLVSIAGLQSLISAISTSTRFWLAKRIWLDRSEKIRIYRISVSTSVISLSSLRSFRFSEETSIASSGFPEVFTRRRLRIYQVKSVTNCPSSRPPVIRSSKTWMEPVTSPPRTFRRSLLNTSVSTAPSTSRTLS